MTYIKENISTLRVAFDGFADYVPVLSTVNNLIDLFQKWAWEGKVIKADPGDAYYTHLKEKNNSDCVWLLIPVIGNIYVHVKPKPPMSVEKFDALLSSPKKYNYAAKQLSSGNDLFFKRLNGTEQLSILSRNPILLGKIDPDEYAICRGNGVKLILEHTASDDDRLSIVDQQPKYLLLSDIIKNRCKYQFDEKFEKFTEEEKMKWVRVAMKYDCDDWLIKLSLPQQYEIIFPSLTETCPREFSNADYIKFFNEIFKENPEKIKDLSEENKIKTDVELSKKLDTINNPNLEELLKNDPSYQLIKSLSGYLKIK